MMKTPESWRALFDGKKSKPGLYLTALPIGNLGDITLRALDMLENADQIWAEDTRNIRKLLSLYDIPVSGRKILACHDHNEVQMIDLLKSSIAAGQIIAYVSDAGMPVISDPGYKLVAAMQEAGVYYSVLPGASSVLAALLLAAAPSDRFAFYGFAPSKSEQRKKFYEGVAKSNMSAIVFESAARLEKSLSSAQIVFAPSTRVCVVREITKTFEEVITDTMENIVNALENHVIKGEIVLVFHPQQDVKSTAETIEAQLTTLLKTMRIKDAVKTVSENSDWSRNDIYDLALALNGKK